MPEPIDPKEYGQLVEAVKNLQSTVNALETDVKELLALANKSKGGLFIMMSLSGSAGAIVSYAISHITWK